MIKISNLKLKPDQEVEVLKSQAAKLLHLSVKDIEEFQILKKSLDARKKENLFYNCSVLIRVKKEEEVLRKNKNPQIEIFKEKPYVFPKTERISKERPVIVGMGPAGLFCGYFLARAGLRPVLIERGRDVDRRKEDVDHFWDNGILIPDSNVQFGEGGAGTFSDGKLNTLVKDKYGRNKEVLRTLNKFGAPEQIL